MWEMMMVWTRLTVVEMEKRGRRSNQQDLAVGWMWEVRGNFGPIQRS